MSDFKKRFKVMKRNVVKRKTSIILNGIIRGFLALYFPENIKLT
jgi:hypothetical protein